MRTCNERFPWRSLTAAVTALVVILLITGCGGTRTVTVKVPLPPASHFAPPESSVTPDGAKPLAPPRKLGLTLGGVHISTAGIRLIEGFEGYSRCAYFDSFGGVWTVGFGQTKGAFRGFCFTDRAAAEANLKTSIEREYLWSVRALGSRVTSNQNAVDALSSFAYNLGAGIFTGSLRSALVSGDFRTAAAIMRRYVHAGGVVLAGLVTRRNLEATLLLRSAPKPLTPAQRKAKARAELKVAQTRLQALYVRQRTLRRVLLSYGCVRRRDGHQKLGATCTRWFQEGAEKPAQIARELVLIRRLRHQL